eukprot:Hpha_TRINITY_DN3866_c0_g1::TRINITY_DN3866_c0_g1_i1::g.44525::m.44525/K08857/NEK1_4_5; NIMA (never in mitosis gene a)-related kinase 1/4/5
MDPPEPSAKAWTSYRRAQCIGAGSFGQVYLADGIPEEGGCPGRHVVKSVYIRDLADQELKTAVNEVQVLKLLQHANVVRYQDHFVDCDGFLNIVMEYCSEGDLAQLIEKTKEAGQRLSEPRVGFMAFQILQAMKYIHSIDIIHRDLKPANIFLTKDHTLKIADFGISKLVGGSSVAQTVVGTPFYLSPEICESRPYNHSADVWSAGCVVYEMAALEKAFTGSNILAVVRKVTEGRYTPLPARYAKVSALLSRMLVVEPQKRATVGALIEEFYTGSAGRLPTDRDGPQEMDPTGVEQSYGQWGSALELKAAPRKRASNKGGGRVAQLRRKAQRASKQRASVPSGSVTEARMPELEFHLLPSQKCLLVGEDEDSDAQVVFRQDERRDDIRDRALRPVERSGRRPSDSFAAAGSGEVVSAARAAARLVGEISPPRDADGEDEEDAYRDDFECDEEAAGSGDGYSDESFERYDQGMSDCDAMEAPKRAGRVSPKRKEQPPGGSPLKLSDADVENIRRALEIDQSTTHQTREVQRRQIELSRKFSP